MDAYGWYRAALKGEAKVHDDGVVHAGFFRRKYKLDDGSGKYGPWIGAAIWFVDGKPICRIGNKLADAHDEWTWLCGNPMPEADVRHYFAHGRWPSEPDMAVSSIEIVDLAKAWRSVRGDRNVLAALIDAAERIRSKTGKLPLGFEIKAKEIAA
jgi:hypothetical protein